MGIAAREIENIRSMLTDTIKILVKNGLTYKKKFNIEGLLGITVDDGDVFLISLNELVKATSQKSQREDSDVEYVDHKSDIVGLEAKISDRGKRKRKRVGNWAQEQDDYPSTEDSDDSPSVPALRAIEREKSENGRVPTYDATNYNTAKSETTIVIPENVKIKTEPDVENWMFERNKSEPELCETGDQQSTSLNNTYLSGYGSPACSNVDMHTTNKTKGGRPMDAVWEYYTRLEDNGRLLALCVCGKQVSAKAGRLREHLKKCRGITLPHHKSQHDKMLDWMVRYSQTRTRASVQTLGSNNSHLCDSAEHHRNSQFQFALPEHGHSDEYHDTGQQYTDNCTERQCQDVNISALC